jgi:hypothetical protein
VNIESNAAWRFGGQSGVCLVFRAIIAFGIGFSAAAQTSADSLAAGATRWVAANAIPIEAVEAGMVFGIYSLSVRSLVTPGLLR